MDFQSIGGERFEAKEQNYRVPNKRWSYPIHYIGKVGNSVIVKGKSDRNWVYISSKSEEELKIIKSGLNNEDRNFAIIEEDNKNSMSLAMGLGFKRDKIVNWFEIE